jgi:CubicO group peptidase (beta-lactamase class C family)
VKIPYPATSFGCKVPFVIDSGSDWLWAVAADERSRHKIPYQKLSYPSEPGPDPKNAACLDYPSVIRASGGMISTAMDYAKFLQMYLNGGRYGEAKILAPESIKKATTAHAKVDERSQYGFGWVITDDGIFSHGGSDGTMAWVDPARDLFALVFTQSPGGKNPTQQFQRIVAESCGSK